MKEVNAGGIQFHRIDRDINGNPRYVCHFLALLTEDEKNGIGIRECVQGQIFLADCNT